MNGSGSGSSNAFGTLNGSSGGERPKIVPLGEHAPAIIPTRRNHPSKRRGAATVGDRGVGPLRTRGVGGTTREQDLTMDDASNGRGKSRGGSSGATLGAHNLNLSRGGRAAARSSRAGPGNRFSPLGPAGRSGKEAVSNDVPIGSGIAYRIKNNKTKAPEGGSIETLRTFLRARYNVELRYLNLDHMAEDSILKNAGLKPPGMNTASSNVGPVFSKLISEMFPDVQTISLARNGLTTVAPFSTLAQYVPNLSNLSLQDNHLSRYKDLHAFEGNRGKLTALKELILLGNPIRDKACAAGQSDEYKKEICTRFPTLTMLDQQPVTPSAPTKLQTPLLQQPDPHSIAPAVFPVAIQPSFFDSDMTKQTASEFLAKYIHLYDHQRHLLLDVYHEQATFSLHVSTDTMHGTAKHHGKTPLAKYLDLNRNQVRRGKVPSQAILYTGPTSISKALTSLPTTRHPLTQADLFLIDAWQVPYGLPGQASISICVAVHGQFEELPSKAKRSFDRSILLVPCPPNSSAASSGWSCQILSDILSIRLYADPKAWSPTALQVRSSVPPTPIQEIGLPSQPQLPGLDSSREQAVAALSAETNLKLHFAHQALQENAWDLNGAREAFNRLKAAGTIPPEAFQ